MLKKKKICTLAAIMFFGIQGLWAGDTATFVDLGFSPDGRTYIFAQYGVQSTTLRPWADLFVVDVTRNNFVSGGRINYIHSRPITAGQDGSGALHRVIAQNASIAERHNVNYNLQGKPLFIAMNDGIPGETIEFRDFENNISYRATLVPSFEGHGAGLRSSFVINLESTTQSGARRTYTVGTPQVRRPLIESYRIRQVMVDPQSSSMIMVIEMRQRADENFNIRFMVEAVRL